MPKHSFLRRTEQLSFTLLLWAYQAQAGLLGMAATNFFLYSCLLGKVIPSLNPRSQPIGTAVSAEPGNHKFWKGRLPCGQSGKTHGIPNFSFPRKFQSIIASVKICPLLLSDPTEGTCLHTRLPLCFGVTELVRALRIKERLQILGHQGMVALF